MRHAPPLLAVLLIVSSIAVVADSGTPSSVEDPAGCEPGALMDLRARVVSKYEYGANVRATVELTVFSWVDLPGVLIRGARADEGGTSRPPAHHEVLTSLAAKSHQRFLFEFDLERGRDHGIFFKATPENPSLDEPEGSAFLRVNLDPGKMPVRKGNLVEFRAKTEAR